MKRSGISFILALCFFVQLFASSSYASGYSLSMLPRYSTEEIHARVKALADYLSSKTGLPIKGVVTSSFDKYVKKVESGAIDIGFANPYIYVLTSKEHEVIAIAEKGRDNDKFRGIVVVPTNSDIRDFTDLKGKTIAIVGFRSAGGYLSQKLTLQEKGIDVKKDCKLEIAPENKQENVALAVFTGDADAGFMRESALNQLEGMVPPGAIQVMASTAWLPNWALSVSRQMPEQDKLKIIEAIKELDRDNDVYKTLKIKGFRMAEDKEYDPVRKAAGLDVSSNIL
jgi:phosphate/phosphite/phosphonate ABC transporter binding protein